MLRFRLKELLAEKEYRENRVITLVEVAEATGIHRVTISNFGHARSGLCAKHAFALSAYLAGRPAPCRAGRGRRSTFSDISKR